MASETVVYRDMEFWDERHTTGKTGWHISDFHPCLVKYAEELLPGRDKRVLVPLCGKTLDLLWLYKAGHRVVGIEGVEKAVQEFGEEHKLDFQLTSTAYGKTYQTQDGRLQIVVADLFSLSSSQIGLFDAVWDRGSIVAINVCDREKYAALMLDMLVPDFRYLMVTLDYTPTPEFSGPPCSLTFPQLTALYGDVADCKILESLDESGDEKFKSRGISPAFEHYILITPRNKSWKTEC